METKEILKDIAPEFANEDDEKIDRFISYSESEVNYKIFDTQDNIDYKKAIAYLTASKLKISKLSQKTNIGGVYKDIKSANLEIKHNGVGSNLAKSMTDNPYQTEFQRLIDMYQHKDIFLDSALL